MFLLIVFQFILGSQFVFQSDHSEDFLLANQLLQLVEADTQYSSEFIDMTKDLRDIFNNSMKVEADEILIRILRFENAILFEKSKPLFHPNDVLITKRKIPGKDLESAKVRALALIKLGLARSRN